MNMSRHINRMSFCYVGNEGGSQINNLLLSKSLWGATLFLATKRKSRKRRKRSNAAEVSAAPSLLKEERKGGMQSLKGGWGLSAWQTGMFLLPLRRELKMWALSKGRNHIKLSSGVMLSCCAFTQSERSEASQQDGARLGRLKPATNGQTCWELSYLFTGFRHGVRLECQFRLDATEVCPCRAEFS